MAEARRLGGHGLEPPPQFPRGDHREDERTKLAAETRKRAMRRKEPSGGVSTKDTNHENNTQQEHKKHTNKPKKQKNTKHTDKYKNTQKTERCHNFCTYPWWRTQGPRFLVSAATRQTTRPVNLSFCGVPSHATDARQKHQPARGVSAS